MRQFGRRFVPDARDARFPMRAVLPTRVAIVSRFYETGSVLDQGDTPMCVGFSWRQFLSSAPLMTTDGPTAPAIYHEAQLNDEWDGENYEGSSVRGGAKALTSDGRLKSYVWAANAADVRDFLITTGTVVMGTNWYRGMFTPKDGVLHVSGAVDGGHAYLLCGYDAPTNRFQMINSWGAEWGQKGKAWIRFTDLDKLIRADGEACAAVEQTVAPVAPTLEMLAADVRTLEQRVAALEHRA
jgi:hypothetical protein